MNQETLDLARKQIKIQADELMRLVKHYDKMGIRFEMSVARGSGSYNYVLLPGNVKIKVTYEMVSEDKE